MLKLRISKRNDLYIFSLVVTYESLPVSLQSIKKTLSNHFQKSPGEVMVYDEHSGLIWIGERMLVKKKLGVSALLPRLCKLRFSKSFQSDKHVY